MRFLQPVAGIVILLIGIVFVVIPGPGLPFVFVGAGLLAGNSLVIARAMDWLEVKLRKLFHWVKGWWSHAALATKSALILFGVFAISAAGYGAYHFFLDR